MAGAWMWVRSEARHRLRSLAALAVIVTVATAVVLAAIAGARRNGTAMDRLVARSEAATVMALPNTPGFDWNEIRKLPYVETVGEFALARYQVVGLPDGFGMFPSASPELFTEVERGIILDGRRPDPARADEALITPGAKRLGLHVGVHVRIALWRAGTVVRAASASSAPPPPDGPVVDVTVVGEMKTPFGIADDSGTVIVSHPFWERFRANVMPLIGVPVDNALIRLRGGDADVPALTQQLDRVAKHAVEVTVFSQERKRITNATSLERAALYGFALAAALAALVLIGQAVVRLVAASGVDVATLRALGTTRLLGAFALSVAPIVAGSVGVVAGAIGAYVASGRFPIGVGRRVEPQPGLHVDWAVLAPGIVIGLALLVAGVGGSAVWYVWRGERERSRRASLVATSVRNAGAPLPVALGTRLALERGHGRSGVPVRPALVGAVVGVL
ncbi:MAG TPA: hypothetical protein VN636_01570, partial [Acidimicrobiia bacterium]|nr:hypothetical protein [Acidimicrobiia bacterium]